MKRSIFLTIVGLAALITFNSCNGSKSNNEAAQRKGASAAGEGAFVFQPAATTVRWTAYKTSDKLPVKGIFKLDSASANSAFTPHKGASLLAAVDGAGFNIPASAIFSGNSERDGILKKFFFGLMDNTVTLKGTFVLDQSDKTRGTLDITMNNESNKVPVFVAVSGDTVRISGVLNINDWHTAKALASLNEHCKAKHTGPDGVSKTWPEVTIEAETIVQSK